MYVTSRNREDLIGIAAWAAGGDVEANQERRGGGEAVGEVGGESHAGGRESAAASRPATTQEEHLGDAAAAVGAGWKRKKQWRRRSRPGTGGGEGGGDGRLGQQQDEEGSSGDEDARGARKRRTPSPGGREGVESPSFLREGTSAVLSNLAATDAPAGEGMGTRTGGEQSGQESPLVRWCQTVSSLPPRPPGSSGSDGGPGAGNEERFFAARVLEPAPRPPPGTAIRRGEGFGVEPDLSGRRDRRSSLVGGGDDDHIDAEPVNRGGETSSALLPAAAAAAAMPTRALSAVVYPNPIQAAPATVAWAGAGAGAGARSGASKPGGKKETFFSGHALEPNPSWSRNVFAKGDAGSDDAPAVATGIVAHQLAHGIERRGWTEETSASSPLVPGELLRSSSEFGGRSGSPPPPATALSTPPVAVALTGSVGGTFRSVSDARAWSRAGCESGEDPAPTCVSAAEQSYSSSSSGAGAGSSGSGGSGSSWDWQVQPEAMAAFFTTVIGLVPPAGTASQPAMRHTRASAAIASSEFPDFYNAGGADDGGGAAGSTAANATAPAAVAAAMVAAVGGGGAGTADARAGSGSGNTESCSMSYAADPGGAGGGEGSSWGW